MATPFLSKPPLKMLLKFVCSPTVFADGSLSGCSLLRKTVPPRVCICLHCSGAPRRCVSASLSAVTITSSASFRRRSSACASCNAVRVAESGAAPASWSALTYAMTLKAYESGDGGSAPAPTPDYASYISLDTATGVVTLDVVDATARFPPGGESERERAREPRARAQAPFRALSGETASARFLARALIQVLVDNAKFVYEVSVSDGAGLAPIDRAARGQHADIVAWLRAADVGPWVLPEYDEL